MCWGKAEEAMEASWGSPSQLMQGGCSSEEEAQREGQQTDVGVGPGILSPAQFPTSPGPAQGVGEAAPEVPGMDL